MSEVSKSKDMAKVPPTAQSTANAASGVVKTLTNEQVHALYQVMDVTGMLLSKNVIEKNGTTTIIKNGEEYKVDAYDITLCGHTIKIKETINANSLSKAAEKAVAVMKAFDDALGSVDEENRISREIDKIAAKVSEEAEKGTITTALKVVEGIQLKSHKQ